MTRDKLLQIAINELGRLVDYKRTYPDDIIVYQEAIDILSGMKDFSNHIGIIMSYIMLF